MRRPPLSRLPPRIPDLKLLLALPGLVLGALGAGLSAALGLNLGVPGLETLVPAVLSAYFALQFLSAVFERYLPSFSAAGGMLEEAVRRIHLTGPWALALSLTSAVGEELFFRGFVLGLGARLLPLGVALLVQAVTFAALHPAPRAAWAYPVWTLLAGLALGGVAWGTGSVWPGVMAHYLFNHQNFNAVLEAKPAGD